MSREPSKSVMALYKQLFDRPRERRSEAYKRGVMAALVTSLESHPVSMPYPMPSAEADAWLSGYEEGRFAAHHYRREEA